MIDLYYWPTSNGRKITIALEEMELAYNIIPVNMRNGDTGRPEFLRINPNGKIPAMVDHDVPGGLVLFESVAMLQYLAEKSGRLMPKEIAARYNVIKWLVFQAASIGPMFGQLAHFHDYAREKFTYALNRYGSEVERLYRVLDTRLGESEYIASSEYSIATSPAGRGSSRHASNSASKIGPTSCAGTRHWPRGLLCSAAIPCGWICRA